jgi:divalent metal cation (Fe/Co/Zn/Cd) transporter
MQAMEPRADGDVPEPGRDQQGRRATEALGRRLQWATIAWNTMEVFVTVSLGIVAGSLALVAFGLDSLVEVFASVVVIWYMRAGEAGDHVRRDGRALRLIGVAFAALAGYLAFAGTRQLLAHDQPDSSPLGITYLAVTALVMFSLARWKRRVGTTLGSEPFRAEASMTFLDGCLATSILSALVLNLTLGWWWADPLAAIVIGAVAAREARDAWVNRQGTSGP